MDSAGYIALSRQVGLFRQMDVIANNIANANTTGFKSDSTLFQEYLSHAGQDNASSFTSDVATITNTGQGPLKSTGRVLDAAIEGEGYFVVKTPLGDRYARAGSFQIDTLGALTTQSGYSVKGGSGDIVFNETDQNIKIKEDGTITITNPAGNQEERGRLQIVKFDNPQTLEKLGNSLFKSADAPKEAFVKDDFRVAQGMLETSNVNSTFELTNMIKVSRAVSGTSKMMDSIHELQRRAVSTISSQQ